MMPQQSFADIDIVIGYTLIIRFIDIVNMYQRVAHLGLSIFNVGFSSRLVTYIDVLTVLHSKGFYHLVAFGSEYLVIDYEVGLWGNIFLTWVVVLRAVDKHTHSDKYAYNCNKG